MVDKAEGAEGRDTGSEPEWSFSWKPPEDLDSRLLFTLVVLVRAAAARRNATQNDERWDARLKVLTDKTIRYWTRHTRDWFDLTSPTFVDWLAPLYARLSDPEYTKEHLREDAKARFTGIGLPWTDIVEAQLVRERGDVKRDGGAREAAKAAIGTLIGEPTAKTLDNWAKERISSGSIIPFAYGVTPTDEQLLAVIRDVVRAAKLPAASAMPASTENVDACTFRSPSSAETARLGPEEGAAPTDRRTNNNGPAR